MMKNLFVLILTFVTVLASAQKMKKISGDFGFLKSASEIQLDLSYDDLKIFKENISEAEYIKRRIAEISADKGAEEAEKWRKDWDYSKQISFRDKFISSWEKSSDIKITENAPYTLKVETIWIYPGWFGGVMSQPAKVSTRLKFVETANPSRILADVESINAPGDGNFVGVANNNDRISEGYAKTAKSLAGFVKKKK